MTKFCHVQTVQRWMRHNGIKRIAPLDQDWVEYRAAKAQYYKERADRIALSRARGPSQVSNAAKLALIVTKLTQLAEHCAALALAIEGAERKRNGDDAPADDTA